MTHPLSSEGVANKSPNIFLSYACHRPLLFCISRRYSGCCYVDIDVGMSPTCTKERTNGTKRIHVTTTSSTYCSLPCECHPCLVYSTPSPPSPPFLECRLTCVKTLGQESRSPLGWVPPPLPSGEQEEHEQQGSSITPFTVGAPAAPATGDVDLDGDAPPPQELTSLDDDVDEIAVVSPPSVAASDGSSNGQGEEQEAGDMAGGGAGIGDDGCARGRSIRT